jgi:hypothetical protein
MAVFDRASARTRTSASRPNMIASSALTSSITQVSPLSSFHGVSRPVTPV